MKKGVIFWIVFIAFVIIIRWDHPVSSDEGMVLSGGWQVSLGQKLYEDIFAIETPGVYYLLAATFKTFGRSYLVAKLLALFLFLSSSLSLYLLAGFFLKNDFLKFLLLYVWLILSKYYVLINHNTFGIFFYILTTYFIFLVYYKKARFLYFLLGLFSGLTFLMIQTKGVLIFFLIVILFFKRGFFEIKKIGYFLFGFIFPLIFLFYWPPRVLFYHLVYFPLTSYLSFNSFIGMIPFYVTIIIYGLIGLILFFRKINTLAWVIFLASLFLFISTYPNPDSNHILLNSVLVPLTIFIFVESFHPEKMKCFQNPYTLLYKCVVGLIVLRMFIITFQGNMEGNNMKDFLQLKNTSLKQLVGYVQSNTEINDFIYAGPFLPGFYFETQRKNPSRYNYMITGYYPKEFLVEMAEALKKNKPALALVYYENVKQYDYNRDNPVDNLITQNYQKIGDIAGVKILKIKNQNAK